MNTFMSTKTIAPLKKLSWEDIATIPIEETNEELIPASYIPEKIIVRPFYYLEGIKGSLPECYLRSTVLDKLLLAADYLRTGYKFIIFDSWRPYRIQKRLFEIYLNKLEKKNPDEKIDYLKKMVSKYVAPPSTDKNAPSPHITGGAIDISIVDDKGKLLNMGTKFDEANERSNTRYYERLKVKQGSLNSKENEFLYNRRLLYNIMTDVGFTNYPEEWWHYDYGNQSWAYFNNRHSAIYGQTEPEFTWKNPIYA